MKVINRLRNYILEDDFRINILDNKINIVNYTKIGNISESSIDIYHDEAKIVIQGEKLVISKLIDQEMLITGIIKRVELR